MRAISELWFIFFGCIVLCVQCTNKTFVATNSWQTIEEGEAIPPGLHVRINLQTGKKEAKLLSEDEGEEKNSALIETKDDRLDPEELKEYLKKLKGDDVSENVAGEKSLRSYEEIKKEFENLNLGVKTDSEIITQLLQEFEQLMQEPPEDPQAMISILTDLEYLVHQYDNALLFSSQGGFSLARRFLNATNDNRAKAEMLTVIGSSVQNNPRVQQAAYWAGCVPALLKLLVLEKDTLVRSKGLYALSCLIRNFPQGQLLFVKDGGLAVFSQIFDDPKASNEKIRMKIINLLTDLLGEIQNSSEHPKLKEHYELLSLELNLWEQGWCQRAADWFSQRENWESRSQRQNTQDLDNDMVEATVNLLLQLSESCLADFVINIELLNAVNRAKQIYADLALHELDDGITDATHSRILDKLRNLAAVFARTTEFKDEL